MTTTSKMLSNLRRQPQNLNYHDNLDDNDDDEDEECKDDVAFHSIDIYMYIYRSFSPSLLVIASSFDNHSTNNDKSEKTLSTTGGLSNADRLTLQRLADYPLQTSQ